jgi:proteasome lid subunit RPN8/RPN11
MIKLTQKQIDEIFAHARRELPNECCGLLGGRDDFVSSIYKSKNIAANPLVEYEAAPGDLFRAQKVMRERGETLVGIYHSHPRQSEPVPSETDVRRAFYPQAVYFIVGFQNDELILRAFRIYEAEHCWTPARFELLER